MIKDHRTQSSAALVIPFIAHPWLKNANLQTIIGSFDRLPGEQSVRRTVTLSDGDQVVLHDDQPATWQTGQPTALLVHGLCGSHRSGYLVRIAARLNDVGIRTFRLDMRGCGAGRALARRPYHSGRSEDLYAALISIATWCPGSSCALVAFSLGANAALKMLGECGDRPPGGLDRAVIVSPPVDLAACVRSLQRYPARIYDRFFTRGLLNQVFSSPTLSEAATQIFAHHRPTRLLDFDDAFTAPLCGFGNAADYYQRCSSSPYLQNIQIHTTILAAADDPIVPVDPLRFADLSLSTKLTVTEHGGHLGFLGCDRWRWMDDFVVNQVII
jgi:uncharacterized protein